MSEECGNCAYWSVFPIDDNGMNIGQRRGTCRRYPAIIDLLAVHEEIEFFKENGKETGDSDCTCPTLWRQPSTWEIDWCGEFKSANKSPIKTDIATNKVA